MPAGKASVGFVPTMGALHAGHMSLISKARFENDTVVSSIFVNPTQFTDKNDLANYPRTPESDEKLLSQAGCDILFFPTVKEIYPDDKLLEIDFGTLESVMEGQFRPGHFKGVATVVYRFFEIVRPVRAYFGEKDFQQLAIIREMNKRMNTGVSIIGCETLREQDGLAFSSRNIHLTADERKNAGVIYHTLKWVAEAVRNNDIEVVRKQAVSMIESTGNFKVQYLEFVDNHTLQTITKWEPSHQQRACIAILTSRTRLIDNIAL
jgi:pantoate--beta-alanine ligase